jgi:hypothetical protein
MLHPEAPGRPARQMEQAMPEDKSGKPARTNRGKEIYQQCRTFTKEEHGAFLLEMFFDKQSLLGKFFDALMKVATERGVRITTLRTERDANVKKAMQTLAKLKKHRKPRRNAERDDEIMRLYYEDKTAGQIVLALADRWKLTDRQVTAAISHRRKDDAK